jgi:hypothetical protein
VLRVRAGHRYRSDHLERRRGNDLFRAVHGWNGCSALQAIAIWTDCQADKTDARYRMGEGESLCVERVKRMVDEK